MEFAVSSVVGEMLMLAAVVIILAVVTINAQSLLPPPREPVVTVIMKNTTKTVTFYHKGGDAVRVGDLRVIIGGVENTSFFLNGEPVRDPNLLFDLGGSIDAGKGGDLLHGDTVRLVTSRAVLYSGVIP
jgi:hypothetical protein